MMDSHLSPLSSFTCELGKYPKDYTFKIIFVLYTSLFME